MVENGLNRTIIETEAEIMSMQKLTPFQVVEIEKTRSQAKKTPVKRSRSHGLACYVPAGEPQASRRVTGSHLDPDSHEMEAAAVFFATGLVQAVQEGGGTTRSLIGPARYSDRVLAKYCGLLIKGALGKPSPFIDHPVSPALVPYLLGGIPWNNVEELCYRALEVMDFFPEPLKVPTLNRAMGNIGFGAHIPHDHHDYVVKYNGDNQPVEVEVDKKYPHLSFRQDFLLNLPREGSYASILIKKGAYAATLRRQLAAWKPQMMAEVEQLLDPAGGEMTEYAAQGRLPVTMNDWAFKRAVQKVFEKDWDQLDLVAGDNSTALRDAETLLARKIIQKISYNDRMTAESLVGISLLTGISVANWTKFAIADRDRRGETFITADELERAIGMIEVSAFYRCDDELRADLLTLKYEPSIMEGKKKWARRLQSAVRPLWSTLDKGYYQTGVDSEGTPRHKYKPFHAPKPEPSDVKKPAQGS